MEEKKYETIFCIINAGFSETVMDAAREAGARGGTVMSGHGTANKEAEQLYKITVQSEKEIVMIIVESKIKDEVLKAINKAAGLNSPGRGIVFSLPVTRAVGLAGNQSEGTEKNA
ncbi:MAG: P-II family nitrogen regulator [Clostridia bacterium]|nr:P-II family nitrogen regulator [Clostridia bacterium]